MEGLAVDFLVENLLVTADLDLLDHGVVQISMNVLLVLA